MKNNTWYRLLAGLLCAVLLLTAAVPAWVLADEADSILVEIREQVAVSDVAVGIAFVLPGTQHPQAVQRLGLFRGDSQRHALGEIVLSQQR